MAEPGRRGPGRPRSRARPAGVDLGTLLAREPSRAVVFCNVLGQIRFLLTDDTFERWALVFQERVARALATRRWVSFHDRVSGTVAPDLDGGAGSDRALEDEEIVHRFFARPTCVPTRYELVDHLTTGLWPASLPRRYFSWQVRPGRFHLIEGIHDPDPDMTSRH